MKLSALEARNGACGSAEMMIFLRVTHPHSARPQSDAQRSDVHLQRRDERLLRNLHLAELAHALLAFLLLLQELALARHVAAVAFRGHVLAEGAHGLARD